MLFLFMLLLVSENEHIIFKASQPRGRASGSRAYGRHEMQGVIIKCTRHECSVCEPKATPAPYP